MAINPLHVLHGQPFPRPEGHTEVSLKRIRGLHAAINLSVVKVF